MSIVNNEDTRRIIRVLIPLTICIGISICIAKWYLTLMAGKTNWIAFILHKLQGECMENDS